VTRNLAAGADHLLVFLDDADAGTHAHLDEHPHVSVARTGGAYWHDRRPGSLNERQVANANVANVLVSLLEVADDEQRARVDRFIEDELVDGELPLLPAFHPVIKPVDEDELLVAVGRALRRDARTRRLVGEIQEARERFALLTPREREVFALVVKGNLNKQIAGQLGTTEQTVKVHRGRVMQKMGVASLAQLVHLSERLDERTERLTDPLTGRAVEE